MTSEILFTALVLVLAAQRLLEVRRSRRNVERLLAQGGVEHAPRQVIAMKVLHGSWLVAMLLEVWWLHPSPSAPTVALAAVLVIAGQSLRYAAIRTLGERWCIPIITLPAAPAIRSGPYRYLDHPNYLGVVLEIAAFPLLHAAWRTSIAFSVLNGVLLAFRIRAENAALHRAATDHASLPKAPGSRAGATARGP